MNLKTKNIIASSVLVIMIICAFFTLRCFRENKWLNRPEVINLNTEIEDNQVDTDENTDTKEDEVVDNNTNEDQKETDENTNQNTNKKRNNTNLPRKRSNTNNRNRPNRDSFKNFSGQIENIPTTKNNDLFLVLYTFETLISGAAITYLIMINLKKKK